MFSLPNDTSNLICNRKCNKNTIKFFKNAMDGCKYVSLLCMHLTIRYVHIFERIREGDNGILYIVLPLAALCFIHATVLS